jgi:DNA-binding response OmpR family regulator
MERDGFEVATAIDGQAGWDQFQTFRPDLLVIDVMMPKKDGYQLCQDIRQESDVPIIMLTARGDERDRVMGLTLGADDYLIKPFSPRELMLRIHNIFRRLRPPSTDDRSTEASAPLDYGNILIDPGMRRVRVFGKAVELTVKEFDVLHVLARRPGQVFSKSQLLDLVWGLESFADASAVTVLVRRLREKIERDPSQPTLVQTVWGIGYKFEPARESLS